MVARFSPHRSRTAQLLWLASYLACFTASHSECAAQSEPTETASYKIEPPLAWNRTDRYEAPDFDAFFPDDPEAGKQLDLLLEGKITADAIERLTLIRRGLRRTSHYRTTILASVGNQLVWNKELQDPLAIELLYHASASSDAEVAHYALYHGPTVVALRTPNLIRMLMDIYPSLDPDLQGRIAWGMRTYGDKEQTRKLLEHLLDDHANLPSATIASALTTYEEVLDTMPPRIERFDRIGLWLIAFHRSDLSANHPKAATVLRQTLDKPLHRRQELLLDFVTRVVDGRETAVALVQGVGARADVVAHLSKLNYYQVDFVELFSAHVLQARRLREFARHLPTGLPKRARPPYTRPPTDATYAFAADEFVRPDFEAFYPEDAEASQKLDNALKSQETVQLSDRELLQLFQRGLRRSTRRPNELFGWIAGALGWPHDPLLTELCYQALDPKASFEVQSAAVYYGYGLVTTKSDNTLKALVQVYLSDVPETSNARELRSRILWSLGQHQDNRHLFARQLEEALKNHLQLSDTAIYEADRAYTQLTDTSPPNVADYASRGVYLVVFRDQLSKSPADAHASLQSKLDPSIDMIDAKFVADQAATEAFLCLRGIASLDRVLDSLQTEPKSTIYFAGPLTQELINRANNDILRPFEKHLSEKQ